MLKRKLIAVATTSVASLSLMGAGPFGSTAFASSTHDRGHNTPQRVSSSTTLDACGYFGGIQTPTESYTYTANGVTYHTEKGTWTGVSNIAGQTSPVASLGSVKGSYTESYSENDGTYLLQGSETFRSNAGKVHQVYSYNAETFSDFNVSVTATRDLSFLTSDTNGHCYTGTYPRP